MGQLFVCSGMSLWSGWGDGRRQDLASPPQCLEKTQEEETALVYRTTGVTEPGSKVIRNSCSVTRSKTADSEIVDFEWRETSLAVEMTRMYWAEFGFNMNISISVVNHRLRISFPSESLIPSPLKKV